MFLDGIKLLMKIHLQRFDQTQHKRSKRLSGHGTIMANKLNMVTYKPSPHHPLDICHVNK